MYSIQVKRGVCSMLTPRGMGRGGGNCQQPYVAHARWRFEVPDPALILLCREHLDELAGHERLSDVVWLYDATVEDDAGVAT